MNKFLEIKFTETYKSINRLEWLPIKKFYFSTHASLEHKFTFESNDEKHQNLLDSIWWNFEKKIKINKKLLFQKMLYSIMIEHFGSFKHDKLFIQKYRGPILEVGYP